MSATLHKWMAKKGVGGGGAPAKVSPAGTIPTRVVAIVLGTMPASASHSGGRGVGVLWGLQFLVPIGWWVNGDGNPSLPRRKSARPCESRRKKHCLRISGSTKFLGAILCVG